VRELKAQGMRPSDIAKALKIGRASVYRVLGQSAVQPIPCFVFHLRRRRRSSGADYIDIHGNGFINC
jgi:DNA invertase Pin-like site-specific DNA recombinase